MTRVAAPANAVVSERFTHLPMTSGRRVRRRSGINANGMPKESVTWLITRTRDGSTPRARTASAGTTAKLLRTYNGILRRRKPCMTTWPA